MKTILFDLDGTLLPMDVQAFMKLYGKSITEHFMPIDQTGKLFEYIMDSVKHTVMTNNGETNYKTFFDHFSMFTKGQTQSYIDFFESYYDGSFSKVKGSTDENADMIKAISILKEKGYNLVIATNPIFPMKANLKRIEWAGLNHEDFIHITSFEENKYCKPHVEFYQEVLDRLSLKPEDVMMVGNDAQEDLVSSKLGIKTFLINDHIIDRTNGNYSSDFEGSYKDFLAFAHTLESR